ncbi:MAG: prenyltransferase/squalene oxidase repeat-containing protein [Promethearchaeota archaeon]
MKNKRNIIITIFIFIIVLNFIPSVLGKSRQEYLTNFIYETEASGKGFKNGIGVNNRMIPEATAYALEILTTFGKGIPEESEMETYIEDQIRKMFNDDTVLLYDLFFLLESLNLLDYSIGESLRSRIYGYLNETEQTDGGFTVLNTTTSPSMSSTYFVYNIYGLIGETFPNETIHKNWILQCNNSDGGYGGNKSLSSTMLSTYYATFLLNEIGTVDDLADKNNTLAYLNSYYVSNPSDVNNFGGYLPDILSQNTLLSSTFYCVSTISLIDDTILVSAQTSQWVISRQNFQDGGFGDKAEGTTQLLSSVVTSYFAFRILSTFTALYRLSPEVWMVEFDYIVLVILMAIIGLVAGIGAFLWRRRRI